MLRITAVGAGAVEYLLRGAGCDHLKERHLEDLARDHEPDAARYFGSAVEYGEPQGRWLGSGMEGLGLNARPGVLAQDDDVRAIFGQLRRPESTEREPDFIGSRPRRYKDAEERFAALVAKEPEAGEERLRELRRLADTSGKRPVAYYDLTFSPVKSVSILYAAYLSAGEAETAEAIRGAHDKAVEIALAYAEEHAAYTRLDGEFVRATGLSAIVFGHSTNRENEPQLHTHGVVLNRVGTADGRIGALDGQAFRPIKEAIATAYERALEQLITEATGAVFETRPDGLAREVVGVDQELIVEGSTRRAQVVDRVEDLIEAYRERHGREPDAAMRKELAQRATLETRRPKGGAAGPTAVAAWAEQRWQWCEQTLDAVEDAAVAARVATPAREAAMAADGRVAAGRDRDGRYPEVVAAAMAAGVADVQTKYATWTLGNLVDAIDRHLGDAAALGVPAAERAAVIEGIARDALSPTAGLDVVQVTGHEPLAVPDALRRTGPGGDGRPRWRPHLDEKYVTAGHLAAEEHVVNLARTRSGRTVTDPALDERLTAMGLSGDQRSAVVGVMGSDRGGAVLIGPAGTGKSRTVGALAHEWTAATSGRVYGVATSQRATMNLAGDGLYAINVSKFLLQFDGPDAAQRLNDRDLLVVDEAGMSSTRDLERLARIAAQAGARIVYTGDPEQLPSVGAGGLFAHLADTLDPGQRHDLDEVHRFDNPWEADASLLLRVGDHRAVDEYSDRGRLHTGTVEQMNSAAARAYIADTLGGRSSLLIVGTKEHAANLSWQVQGELVGLGLVGHEVIATLNDNNPVAVGDRIQARRNAYDLQVDAPADEHGRRGERRHVTNRELYTVIGRDEQGHVLARDDRGAVAHLPLSYLRDDAVLGYAITTHGAQGVTVDSGHPVLDRDATREHAYVGSTRGRHENHLWLVTGREPDEHEPQRVSEQAAERLAAVLDNRGASVAATTSRDAAEHDVASLSAVASRFDFVTALAARERHEDLLGRALGDHDRDRLAHDPGRERLLRSLREAELAGHDTGQVVDRATETSLTGAESVADVLRARIRATTADREPERTVETTDWASRALTDDGEVGGYVRDVAELASQRQTRLGQDAAERAPQWAVEALGAPPERHDGEGPVTEPRGRWEDRAGVAAAYREVAGIDDEQRSLGPAPSRERELDRALWRDAVDALGHSPDQFASSWRAAADAELYAARERWAREQDAAPRWVADDLAERHDLARQYREDAAFERTRLDAMALDDPQHEDLASRAERSEYFADHHQRAAADLEIEHQDRRTWWESRSPEREADAVAADELAKRNLPATREVVPDESEPRLDPAPAPIQSEPVPAPAAEPDRAAEQRARLDEALRVAHEKVAAARERVSEMQRLDVELEEDEAIRSRGYAAEHQQELQREMDGPELGDDW